MEGFDARATAEPGGIATLEYAHLGFVHRRSAAAVGWLWKAAALLTIPSLAVVWQSGQDEPYTGTIHRSDAFVQVGLGFVLIAFWLIWCVVAIVMAIRRVAPRWVLAALAWAALMVCLLTFCANGYVGDLIEYQTPYAP